MTTEHNITRHALTFSFLFLTYCENFSSDKGNEKACYTRDTVIHSDSMMASFFKVSSRKNSMSLRVSQRCIHSREQQIHAFYYAPVGP